MPRSGTAISRAVVDNTKGTDTSPARKGRMATPSGTNAS